MSFKRTSKIFVVRFKLCYKRAQLTQLEQKKKHKSAQTVRTCEPVAVDGFPGISKLANPEGRQLLKVEPAMWLFVTTEDVEPTNNAAERAIRPAVIWRRTSFGTQTQAGSTFVARMLTVIATLKSQRRDVLEFMTQAVVAARLGQPTP